MDHVAIMNPKWRLIEKILSGEKTIESRWYVHKIAPWNHLTVGDTIYFKDAGKLVTAKAIISKVIQVELKSIVEGLTLSKQYQRELCFTEQAIQNTSWLQKKRYAILIFLSDPQSVEPFAINKSGFGSACAWLCVQNIERIKAA